MPRAASRMPGLFLAARLSSPKSAPAFVLTMALAGLVSGGCDGGVGGMFGEHPSITVTNPDGGESRGPP